jgi:hypothetical protein
MTGTYSDSNTGRWKQSLDAEIAKTGVAVDEHNEAYLKQLVLLCTDYSSPVSDRASTLQFYIIDGGAEGFLDSGYAHADASKVTGRYSGTGWIIFDNNDLMVAFAKDGKLISSSLLRRPVSITYPGVSWTEATANNVYKAWDNRPVNLYYNTNFTVSYYGLAIDDSVGYYRGFAIDKKTGKKIKVEKVTIDLHKEEGTYGCIFIADAGNPKHHFAHPTDEMLSHFEPQFIKDIQKAIGAKTGNNIGTMRMLSVWGWMPGA